MAFDHQEVEKLIERAVARSFRAVFGEAPTVAAIANMSERVMALRVDDDEMVFQISLGDENDE